MFTLEPTSVALIGASGEEKKLGHYILQNLLSGFTGKVFPVNPKHDELLGVKCYHTVADISEEIDLAVIVTPAATVAAVAEECGKKKVKTLVVISAGFGELGTKEGHALEAALLDIAKKYEMSLVGPNCLGVLRPSIKLNASFADSPEKDGDIALISQSGAMAVALLDEAGKKGIGFSLVVSIGNKADLSECDFLVACEKDPKTKVIGLYLESIKDGARFMHLAERIGKKKPIILIKAGLSARGAKAVSSHTGALAGSSAALEAACRAAGIHLASTVQQFVSMLSGLRMTARLESSSIAIITNAGGPGVLATDATELAGLTLSELETKTVETLKKALPAAASSANPIDVLGDALAGRYSAALRAVASDANTDGIVCLLTPQVMTPCDEIADAIIGIAKTHPLLPITTAFMGAVHVEQARKKLQDAGIPSFETPEEAVFALSALRPLTPKPAFAPDATRGNVTATAMELLKKKTGLLSESSTAELLKLYGLEVPRQALARSTAEAVEIAHKIGYPVIAKISSPTILHKTDVGGVRAHLTSDSEVKKAFGDIVKNCEKNVPGAAIHGVLLQEFVPVGSEFIVGAVRDASFGPLVMVGLGGIYTELFRDTRFAIAPVSLEESYEMLSSLKSWKLLTGMRGKNALDIDALANTIHTISKIIADCPSITEIDLNPILVREKGVMIADAKVVC